MKLIISANATEMGKAAAKKSAEILRAAIAKQGWARLVLSTGASQFEVLEHLVKENLDWSKVEMFHLDEYIGIPAEHPASFQKYLEERFTKLVNPGKVNYVQGIGNVEAHICSLTAEIRRDPIDLALVGVGENGHIAFNDPPADFSTREAFKLIDLVDERCRRQQMGEGWFKTVDEVPPQAITMTVYQIMLSRCVISVVGGTRKAQAVRDTLAAEENTPMIPATILREHPDWLLYVDEDSAALHKMG
ncbi:MAG: glucosamine-6-phosphate deaminase [Christensenellales bacterium]|jgi:glucosamine-6-phosphate deaminase